MCADLIHSLKASKEIIRNLTEAYGVSVSCVEKWIKAARPIVAERKERAEAVRAKVDAEEIEAIAKDLGISRRTILAELRKVAYMDVRLLYKEDGTIKKFSELDDETAGAIAGVEVFEEYDARGNYQGTNRKVKSNSKLTAIDQICKIMGYMPQPGVKVKIDEPDGETKKTISVTLNLS